MATLQDFDVIIVGAGAAGTSAAVSAAEKSRSLGKALRIGMIERGNEDEWGGNSRWTTANFQMSDSEHINPTLYEDLLRDSQGLFPKDYARVLVKEAPATVSWVSKKGVIFEKVGLRTSQPRMAPVGGGFAIISVMRREAEKLGISIILESTAYKLSVDGSGGIDGIWVRSEDGKTARVSCSAVILAGGGFEGNKEMLTRYISKEAAFVVWEVPGTKMHLGECINMALEIGARPAGQYSGYHGFPVDLRSDAPEPPLVLGPGYGILVNKEGRRFTDEGVPFDSLESVSQAIIQQPGNKAYLILDQKAQALPDFKTKIGTQIPPLEARTLEELARLIQLPQDVLLDTIAEFNKGIPSERTEPTELDKIQTIGITPRKSGYALSIEVPPFYCYPVASTVEFTWGGLDTDTAARVIATNGAPIPGLYAAGEIVGSNYHHYTGGSSVMRSLVFGRIAGARAVEQAHARDS